MDKKEIYEHLAKIYLDASSKKKKRVKPFQYFSKNPLFIGSFVALIVFSGAFLYLKATSSHEGEIALVLLPDAAKLNFHFGPAKKETLMLSLNDLNLNRYKVLSFNIKKVNYKDNIHLRVEFANNFREKSEVYLDGIQKDWKELRINLADFKKITDWSQMKELVFTIEEWNVVDKKGIVYVDNVRLLK